MAVPVTWDELAKLRGANEFTMADIGLRLKQDCPAAKVQENLQTLSDSVIEALERLLEE